MAGMHPWGGSADWDWLRKEGQKFGPDFDDLARLMDKTKAWAKQEISDRPNYLAMGAELQTFLALAARRNDWLSDDEREFVAASNKAREAEEKRKADDAAKLKRQCFGLVSSLRPRHSPW